MIEQVLVVPARFLGSARHPAVTGFLPGSAEGLFRLVREEGFFTPRAGAEGDPSLKQIIPYGMVRSAASIFLMRRTRKGGEERLHDKLSLGVGGHVNPEDLRGGDTAGAIDNAFERELNEELEIGCGYRKHIAGLLNDDATPVGAVHLGVVYWVDLEAPLVRVREADVLEGDLVGAGTLREGRAAMESWSRILTEHFWPAG
jgi:predicted NUDIX family phosphoesterase